MKFILFLLLIFSSHLYAQELESELIKKFEPAFEQIFAYTQTHDTIPGANISYLKELFQNNPIQAPYYTNGLKLIYARNIYKTDITKCLQVLKEVDFFLTKNSHLLHLRLLYNMILGRINLEIYGKCQDALQL